MLSCGFDDFGCEAIDGAPTRIVALQRVAVRDVRKLAYAHSTTPLTRQSIFFILTFHHFVRETALQEIEV